MVVRLLLAVIALIPALVQPADARSAPLRVLIVDGVNNHDWPATTPVLKSLLEDSGRFRVDVSPRPPRGAPEADWTGWRPRFARYDVVLSHLNGGDQRLDVITWPAAVRPVFAPSGNRRGGFVHFHTS